MVTNLIFSYSGRVFAPPVPALRSIDSGGVGREDASEDWGKKVVDYLSLVLVHCYQFASLAHQVQLQPYLDLPDSIPTQPGSAPLFFPGYLSLLPLPGLDFTLCLTRIPQDCELHQCMITVAQAASNLDITD
ncbi:hypothetical protein QYF61_003401 [Mycteria americana]|uniref:Uncharacterized protein n=1 Tax=Mycteria americana TaxID=33587 RepID=A0AAN7PN64_MYCAM|nr:hypothetical protein QYF61_003401 [Mycteria americana]